MKKTLVAALMLCSVLISNEVEAQQNLTIMNYSMGLGTGNTGDFISKYSWRGFGFDYRYLSQPNVGVGINLGWNTFYEEMPKETYVYETVSATGYQYRYLNSFPITAVVDYYFKPDNQVNPYAGLGVGVEYNLASVDFGIYRFEQDGWPFTINPEFGILVKPSNGPVFNVGVKYFYGFATKELEADSHFLFNLGFAFGE